MEKAGALGPRMPAGREPDDTAVLERAAFLARPSLQSVVREFRSPGRHGKGICYRQSEVKD